MSHSGLSFKNVWKNQTPEDTEKIIQFWSKLGALPPGNDGHKRAEQIVFMVLNLEDELIAVCTSYLATVEDLHGSYFHFRCLVSPKFRQGELAGDMLNKTFEFLESSTIQNNQTACKGMYIEVENKHLLQHKNEAIWPKTGFVFIGTTPKGTHRRVRYFSGARI